MSIMVRDAEGYPREVADDDKTGAALGLGIAGTALGVLNTLGGVGGIGNLFGGGGGLLGHSSGATRSNINIGGTEVVTPYGVVPYGYGAIGGYGVNPYTVANDACNVHQTKYYEDRIQDIKDNNGTFMNIQKQLCDLNARISSVETTDYYQNEISKIGFADVDKRFAVENILNEKNLQLATCNMVRGTNVLLPNQLAEPFVKTDRALSSYRVENFTRAVDPCGGYSGYNTGCGCC